MRGRIVEHMLELVVVLLGELVERPPLGVRGGNWVGLKPAAVRKLVEVRAWRTGRVDVGGIEWLGLPVASLRARGARDEGGDQPNTNAWDLWHLPVRRVESSATVWHGASPISSRGARAWTS